MSHPKYLKQLDEYVDRVDFEDHQQAIKESTENFLEQLSRYEKKN